MSCRGRGGQLCAALVSVSTVIIALGKALYHFALISRGQCIEWYFHVLLYCLIFEVVVRLQDIDNTTLGCNKCRQSVFNHGGDYDVLTIMRR